MDADLQAGLHGLNMDCHLDMQHYGPAIQRYCVKMIAWLHVLLDGITKHKPTEYYQEAVRRSGSEKGRSGLTATERQQRDGVRILQRRKQQAKELTKRWNDEVGWGAFSQSEARSLAEYWSGRLDEQINALQRDRGYGAASVAQDSLGDPRKSAHRARTDPGFRVLR